MTIRRPRRALGLAAGAFLFLIGTCAAQTVVDATGGHVEAGLLPLLIESVADEFRDPLSVQIRRITSSKTWWKDASRRVYCGEVNAKNGYGGYGGFQKFIFEAQTKDVTILKPASDPTFELSCVKFQIMGCDAGPRCEKAVKQLKK